jgi:hypothetical protein
LPAWLLSGGRKYADYFHEFKRPRSVPSDASDERIEEWYDRLSDSDSLYRYLRVNAIQDAEVFQTELETVPLGEREGLLQQLHQVTVPVAHKAYTTTRQKQAVLISELGLGKSAESV